MNHRDDELGNGQNTERNNKMNQKGGSPAPVKDKDFKIDLNEIKVEGLGGNESPERLQIDKRLTTNADTPATAIKLTATTASPGTLVK